MTQKKDKSVENAQDNPKKQSPFVRCKQWLSGIVQIFSFKHRSPQKLIWVGLVVAFAVCLSKFSDKVENVLIENILIAKSKAMFTVENVSIVDSPIEIGGGVKFGGIFNIKAFYFDIIPRAKKINYTGVRFVDGRGWLGLQTKINKIANIQSGRVARILNRIYYSPKGVFFEIASFGFKFSDDFFKFGFADREIRSITFFSKFYEFVVLKDGNYDNNSGQNAWNKSKPLLRFCFFITLLIVFHACIIELVEKAVEASNFRMRAIHIILIIILFNLSIVSGLIAFEGFNFLNAIS